MDQNQYCVSMLHICLIPSFNTHTHTHSQTNENSCERAIDRKLAHPLCWNGGSHTRLGEIQGFHLPAQWMRGSKDRKAKFQINIVSRILHSPFNRVTSVVKFLDVGGLETSEDPSTSLKSRRVKVQNQSPISHCWHTNTTVLIWC
jgi:hypothetical protein